MRLGAASTGTKAPEKQAETTTMVGRSRQVSSSMAASRLGDISRSSTTTPEGAPWELK